MASLKFLIVLFALVAVTFAQDYDGDDDGGFDDDGFFGGGGDDDDFAAASGTSGQHHETGHYSGGAGLAGAYPYGIGYGGVGLSGAGPFGLGLGAAASHPKPVVQAAPKRK